MSQKSSRRNILSAAEKIEKENGFQTVSKKIKSPKNVVNHNFKNIQRNITSVISKNKNTLVTQKLKEESESLKISGTKIQNSANVIDKSKIHTDSEKISPRTNVEAKTDPKGFYFAQDNLKPSTSTQICMKEKLIQKNLESARDSNRYILSKDQKSDRTSQVDFELPLIFENEFKKRDQKCVNMNKDHCLNETDSYKDNFPSLPSISKSHFNPLCNTGETNTTDKKIDVLFTKRQENCNNNREIKKEQFKLMNPSIISKQLYSQSLNKYISIGAHTQTPSFGEEELLDETILYEQELDDLFTSEVNPTQYEDINNHFNQSIPPVLLKSFSKFNAKNAVIIAVTNERLNLFPFPKEELYRDLEHKDIWKFVKRILFMANNRYLCVQMKNNNDVELFKKSIRFIGRKIVCYVDFNREVVLKGKIKNCYLDFGTEDLNNLLGKYGRISNFRYVTELRGNYVFETNTAIFDLTLDKKAKPEDIATVMIVDMTPLIITFRGVSPQCFQCKERTHLVKDCPQKICRDCNTRKSRLHRCQRQLTHMLPVISHSQKVDKDPVHSQATPNTKNISNFKSNEDISQSIGKTDGIGINILEADDSHAEKTIYSNLKIIHGSSSSESIANTVMDLSEDETLSNGSSMSAEQKIVTDTIPMRKKDKKKQKRKHSDLVSHNKTALADKTLSNCIDLYTHSSDSSGQRSPKGKKDRPSDIGRRKETTELAISNNLISLTDVEDEILECTRTKLSGDKTEYKTTVPLEDAAGVKQNQ